MNDSFNIEEYYQLYLKKVNLREIEMSHIQSIETRKAFFAGCASLFDIFVNKIPSYSDPQAYEIIDNIGDQLLYFFKNQL